MLYQEIRQYLFTLIDQQECLNKLPSERELQEKFQSTRITVREALVRLEAEGIIYRQKRKGWFICPPRLRWDPVKKVNFYQLAQEQGFSAVTQLISFEGLTRNEVGEEIAAAFSSQAPQFYHSIQRVRTLEQRPVMVEEIYCCADQFLELATKPLEGSITTIFQQDYGVDVTHERSQIYVTAVPEDKADILNLNSGASCLKIIRQRFNASQQLIDYNLEFWVHSTIEIQVESS